MAGTMLSGLFMCTLEWRSLASRTLTFGRKDEKEATRSEKSRFLVSQGADLVSDIGKRGNSEVSRASFRNQCFSLHSFGVFHDRQGATRIQPS